MNARSLPPSRPRSHSGRTAGRSWVDAIGVAVAVGAVGTAAAVWTTLVTIGGDPTASAAGALGAGIAGGAIAGWLSRRGGAAQRRDTRWTALLGTTSTSARETLAVVERLTDPLAIERRVTEEMQKLVANARLELLRNPDAPQGALAHARVADPVLLRASIERGVVRRGSGGTSPEVEQVMNAAAIDLAFCVRYGVTVYGLLGIAGSVRGAELVQLRRFADLLAFKLELHRVYGELAHREQLAAVGAFAAGLAHDLRSPLASVRLSVQAIARHREALGDDAELLDIAEQEVDRLNDLVAELLDFSRPVTLATRAVDLSAVIVPVVRRREPIAAQAGISITTELPASLPTLVVDPSRLDRVIDNLLGNAIAVAPRGSDVRVRAQTAGEHVVIDVIDRGPGIAKDDRARIFEPFFTRRKGGIGLGLAVARRIVEAHGGTIEVDSAPGRGTRMSVRLPVGATSRDVDV